ncbi:hypothetical protein [Leucobacter sp. gxy201]|uniref:hypothetical protein n=1 Tax=Leucobacter sp. gxy201 TaxID=2957200 RepID=UPI003DA042FD
MNGSRAVVRPRGSLTGRARVAGPDRSVRTLRGIAGSMIATLFAATSHAAAGGEITGLAVLVTATLSLPLCVLLAGRVASLWRLAVAVGGSQFLYHWVFAGLGAGAGAPAGGTPIPLHAAHLEALQSFAPTATPAAAGTAMWVWHAVAAALTIALVHRGERAALALLRLVRRAAVPRFDFGAPTAPRCSRPRLSPAPPSALRDRLLGIAAITHRGPPSAAQSIAL